jgi:GrpB-like predicted nucleotidyltransferase (UPF0157 family)
VPFPDEPLAQRVEVVPYRTAWADEGPSLAAWLCELLPGALTVQHIGSTSVPGLAAKDCLDLMVQVHDLSGDEAAALERHGYRRRTEPWNLQEVSFGTACRKQVFAPPVGGRPCNIHVREHGGPNVRYTLLFRDFLTADAQAASAWGRFKTRLAQSVTGLADYGQIKAPAQDILMQAAQQWARDQDWQPEPL